MQLIPKIILIVFLTGRRAGVCPLCFPNLVSLTRASQRRRCPGALHGTLPIPPGTSPVGEAGKHQAPSQASSSLRLKRAATGKAPSQLTK